MTPLNLFYSYTHADETQRDQLEKHLSQLRREGMIAAWHDREILPGGAWADEIDTHLETASIILLLVSPDFLASDYCYEKEMLRALERHRRGDTRVIPIILRSCDWQHSPLKDLQCLPHDGKPATEWDNPDAAFLDITKGLRKVIERLAHPFVPLSPLNRQNRMRMLKQVQRIWIDGLLTQSLHDATRIELNLQDRPDVLTNPLRLQVQELDQTPKTLPDGTTIVQVYDKADGELLILGEAGAGKTTLLLELTATLIERAEKDERLPMPIVFNLSSWAEKRQPLSKWLVEELQTKYQVPRKIGKGWTDANQVLPLLDGLDEVAKDARSACVQAINDYYQSRLERGSSPMVVCCRSEEYAGLSTCVMLQHAVSILPLTDPQIDTYLEHAGEQVRGLRKVVNADTELHSLARQPLMLKIFMLAYQGATASEVPIGGTHEGARYTIFARYVERMLKRREQSRRWKPEQVIRWLTFLAKQMQEHNQTVFSVESLQPSWLSRKWRLLFQWCVRLPVGLIFGLVLGSIGSGLLVIGLVFGLGFGLVLLELIVELSNGGLVYNGRLVYSLILGIVLGLGSGLVFRPDTGINPAKALVWSWKKARSGLVFKLVFGLIFGLGFGLSSELFGGPLHFGLFGGMFLVLPVGLGSGLVFQSDTRIHPAEVLVWSWKKALSGLIFGLVLALFISMLFRTAIIVIIIWLIILLVIGLVGGLPIGLVQGLSGRRIPERLSLSPNEGIWRSSKNGLIFGLVGGLVFGLIFGLVDLISLLIVRLPVSLIFNLVESIFLLIVGLPVGLVFGLGLGRGLGLIFRPNARINPSEALIWSWKKARSWLISGVIISVIGGVIVPVIDGDMISVVGWSGVITWLIILLIGGLIFGLVGGLSGRQLPERLSLSPNEGIRRSSKNGLIFGLIFGLVFGLVGVLIFGLDAFVKHFVLRFFLSWRGDLPWDLVPFLDEAAERLLLRKVGGSYIFVHRMLLDYFVELEGKNASHR